MEVKGPGLARGAVKEPGAGALVWGAGDSPGLISEASERD